MTESFAPTVKTPWGTVTPPGFVWLLAIAIATNNPGMDKEIKESYERFLYTSFDPQI